MADEDEPIQNLMRRNYQRVGSEEKLKMVYLRYGNFFPSINDNFIRRFSEISFILDRHIEVVRMNI